jgi:hypothetical protein
MSKELQMRKALRFIPILVIFVAFGASTAHADNTEESYYIPPPPNADLVDNAVEAGAVIFAPVPEISSAVPEPGSLYLTMLGMALLGLMSVRKRISLIDNSR